MGATGYVVYTITRTTASTKPTASKPTVSKPSHEVGGERFGLAWARLYNKSAFTAKQPWLVHQIGCVELPNAIYQWSTLWENKTTNAIACTAIVIGSDSSIMNEKPELC